MTLFAALVSTSGQVGADPSRLAKVRALAALLRALEPAEIEIAVAWLAGEIPQGRSGIGAALLRPASAGAAAESPTLRIHDVNEHLAAVAASRGGGSQAQRLQLLRELFSRATDTEHEFLIRLLLGGLRQGALTGVMVESIAAAGNVPLPQVRRAAMYADSLGAVARVALLGGGEALAQFQLAILSPIAPMLAQTAAGVAQALELLTGDVAFEWKMDGARMQVHRSEETIRVYTRNLNEVTAAVPEVVDAVRALPARDLILDGEALAFNAAGRPHPFQVTMRRFGRRLNVEESRSALPLRAFFFDCLRANG